MAYSLQTLALCGASSSGVIRILLLGYCPRLPPKSSGSPTRIRRPAAHVGSGASDRDFVLGWGLWPGPPARPTGPGRSRAAVTPVLMLVNSRILAAHKILPSILLPQCRSEAVKLRLHWLSGQPLRQLQRLRYQYIPSREPRRSLRSRAREITWECTPCADSCHPDTCWWQLLVSAHAGASCQ